MTLLIFVVTFNISFLGSVHPGPLNLSVIQTTLQKNITNALFVAIGGVIPEIIYGLMAIEGVLFFEKNPAIFQIMQWAVVPILLILGIMNLLKKSKKSDNKAIENFKAIDLIDKYHLFAEIPKGFILSIFNPQLCPFWTVILINYQNYNYLKINELSNKIAFVLGASIGAFALNYLYARIAESKKDLIFGYINIQKVDIILGITFIGMAILQTIKLL
jgi:threonine/homoserine/homoserine lactone efflux protein